MSKAQYHPTDVKAWAVLYTAAGDRFEVPASSINLEFAMSSIPIARVSLSVGVEAAHPTKKSTAHIIGPHLKRGTRIELWCQLEGEAGPLDGEIVYWPADPFMIFDGKIGVATPELGNGLRVSVGIIHWLGDLDETCWLSSMFDPGSASSWSRPLAHPMDPLSGQDAIWWLSLAGRAAAPDYLTDMWGDAMKPVLKALAAGTHTTSQSLAQQGSWLHELAGEPTPNFKAVAALERMDLDAHMPVTKLPLFKSAEPGDENAFLEQFVEAAGRQFWSPEGSATLWSKLVRFMKYCEVAISPGVETATVMPWMPVTNTPWITLDPEDVWSLVLNSHLPRIYRGFAFIPRGVSLWHTRPGNSAAARGVLGLFDVTQFDSGVPADLIGDNPGTMIITHPPHWLELDASSMQTASDYRDSLGWTGSTGKYNPPRGHPPVRKMGDKLAKALFLSEVFKLRAGALTSRLRFDIAPGSMIKFKDVNPDFDVPGFTGEGVMANVSAVRISINAKPPRCMTTIDINHVRMDYETSMTVTKHPLFDDPWVGGPLANVDGVTPSW